jgi:hypothetical protein
MLPLDCLRVALARMVLFGIEMTPVYSPTDGMSEPPLVLLLPYKAPHLVDFGVVTPMDDDVYIARR